MLEMKKRTENKFIQTINILSKKMKGERKKKFCFMKSFQLNLCPRTTVNPNC